MYPKINQLMRKTMRASYMLGVVLLIAGMLLSAMNQPALAASAPVTPPPPVDNDDVIVEPEPVETAVPDDPAPPEEDPLPTEDPAPTVSPVTPREDPIHSNDSDGDGVGEGDNCPYIANPDQADANQNGIGDACEDTQAANVPSAVHDFSVSMNGVFVEFTHIGPASFSYSWNFGDGNSSSEENPLHEYAAAGTYSVTLTVVETEGASPIAVTKAVVVTDTVLPAMVCDFSLSHDGGDTPTVPLTVSFNNLSENADSFTWTFGDGSGSILTNPTHTYTTAGTFNILLVCSRPGETLQATGQVSIAPATSSLSATFVSTQASPADLFTFNFDATAVSTGTITGYAWTFGDGGSSSEEDPTHTYAAPGTYYVHLVVTDSLGNTVHAFGAVEIYVGAPAPLPAFSVSPQTGPAPLEVSISNETSGGPVTQWSWNFGDGYTLVTTDNLPSLEHTYTSIGTYTITLNASGPGGSGTTYKQVVVTVNDTPVQAQFSHEFVGSYGPDGQQVCFSNDSTGPVASFQWNLASGGASTEMNPCAYFTEGTYIIELRVVGTSGQISTASKRLNVVPNTIPPIASFNVNATSGTTVTNFNFTDTSTGVITNWSWDFGDGSALVTTRNVSNKRFNTAGAYVVTLTVTGPGGSSSASKTLTITAVTPTCAIGIQPDIVRAGDTVTLTGFANNLPAGVTATAWDWTISNPAQALSGQVVTFLAATPSFTASLRVTLSDGSFLNCARSRTVYAADFIYATCSATPNDPSVGQVVNFNVNPSLPAGVTVASYQWNFNGEGSAAIKTPTFSFSTIGAKNVSVLVTSSTGSQTTAVCNVTVYDQQSLSVQVDPETELLPYTVTFTAVGGPRAFSGFVWTLPDGSTAYGQSVDYIVTTAGDQWASVVGTWKYGELTASGKTVGYTTTTIQAAFTPDKWTGVVPVEICFTDESVSETPITSWLWDLGNGETSTEQNPCTTYTVAGDYTVTLTINNTAGLTAMATNNIKVFSVVQGGSTFTVDPSNTTTICFTVSMQPGETVVMWDFGDGTVVYLQPSDDPNLCHTYASGGDYEVTMVVQGAIGQYAVRRVVTVSEPIVDLSLSHRCGDEGIEWLVTNPNTYPVTISFSVTGISGGTGTVAANETAIYATTPLGTARNASVSWTAADEVTRSYTDSAAADECTTSNTLTLTYQCGFADETTYTWQVVNTTGYTIDFTWDVTSTALSGGGTVGPNGSTSFTTPIQSFPTRETQTLNVYVGETLITSQNSGTPCKADLTLSPVCTENNEISWVLSNPNADLSFDYSFSLDSGAAVGAGSIAGGQTLSIHTSSNGGHSMVVTYTGVDGSRQVSAQSSAFQCVPPGDLSVTFTCNLEDNSVDWRVSNPNGYEVDFEYYIDRAPEGEPDGTGTAAANASGVAFTSTSGGGHTVTIVWMQPDEETRSASNTSGEFFCVPPVELDLTYACPTGSATRQIRWTVLNPNGYDVAFSWYLDRAPTGAADGSGVVPGGTVGEPGSLEFLTTSGGAHTVYIVYGEGEGSSETSESTAANYCKPPKEGNPDPTPTPGGGGGAGGGNLPALLPPANTGDVLIPVTGADLRQLPFAVAVQRWLTNLGLLLLGVGMVLNGLTRRPRRGQPPL